MKFENSIGAVSRNFAQKLQESAINYEFLRYPTDSTKSWAIGIVICCIETTTFYNILQYSTTSWNFSNKFQDYDAS